MLKVIKKYDFSGFLIAKQTDNIITEGKKYSYDIVDEIYVVFLSDKKERRQLLYSFLKDNFHTPSTLSKKRNTTLRDLLND